MFATLRAFGLDVEATDKPLDALVGFQGRTYCIEVKDGPKAPLTDFQVAFFGRWRGHAAIIRDVAEAEAFAKAVRGGAI
ncbi:hypothetical protein [Oceaniglobus trochenteri]|uniref:hypothetical protein n=1 Tax=Oceaniglobus trochenteri TaxID=2763260 RepID=UPI001CFF71B6|nr:hypothetical protein [Oceaniglobus trochenteri]